MAGVNPSADVSVEKKPKKKSLRRISVEKKPKKKLLRRIHMN